MSPGSVSPGKEGSFIARVLFLLKLKGFTNPFDFFNYYALIVRELMVAVLPSIKGLF